MEDDRRVLDQREALRNVRALLERLERIERATWRRQWWLALVVVGPIGVVLALSVLSPGNRKPDAAEQRRIACVIDYWASKSGDFERRLRQESPDAPRRDIAKRLERERPFIMAAADVECTPAKRSAGP